MNKDNVIELSGRETNTDPLTELLRSGAQKLIQQAIETELNILLDENADRRTESEHAGVVRNGYLPEREIQTGIGPVTVKPRKIS